MPTSISYTRSALVSPKPVRAATAPNAYSHSWYIHNDSSSAMYNLGAADGQFDNSNCNQSLIVLDFGQVGYNSGSYGTYLFGSPYPFTSDAQILSAAETYASGWYWNTNNCPRVKIALGTSNNQECPGGGSCGPYYAGGAWELITQEFQSWLVNNQWNWQIVAYAADDIETEWDSVSTTLGTLPNGTVGQGFVFGYNNESTYPPILFDYGDDDVPYGTWAQYDVYEASWGIGWDVPLPEIYYSGQVSQYEWPGLYSYYHGSTGYVFWGVMAECAGNPGSTGTCSNPYGEYTPYSGWWALYNPIGAGAYTQQSNATNILPQTGY